LDYEKATKMIEEAFASRDMPTIKSACTQLLAAHISTRERLAILDEFYPRLFAITGKPQTILDLACGLNPLTFPWMDLSSEVQYYAYDIHQPRVRFINHFFTLAGLSPLATWQDVLIEPPQVKADVAFFFKEAHRFEQRQKNSNRVFFQMLPVRFLLVSLPPTSMSGQHNLVEQQRRLVHTSVEGLDWEVTEVSFQNELVFVIEKDQT
jgi:16S rRNA (guanine(1405)-N(7))-methyltransferase